MIYTFVVGGLADDGFSVNLEESAEKIRPLDDCMQSSASLKIDNLAA
jgi:hypothetical protein